MRNYGQYCPIARGSEILAERWVPIILRNVLLGCRTFNDIAAGAPGLSRTLLIRRLRELQHAGLVEISPKPDGRGSLYVPTRAGRELWPVLQALGDWAERWMEVTAEHADPDAVLWSWCHSSLRHDLLPDRRVVVRFEFTRLGRRTRLWLLIDRCDGEICNFDPGFGDDVVVTVEDPLVFAQWHLGLVEWEAALKCGAIHVDGPRQLGRSLPTWNANPENRRRRRAEHEREPGGPSPFPPQAVQVPGRMTPPPTLGGHAAHPIIPGFTGQVVTPDLPGYDEARALWNGAIDRRPRYIARCTSRSDVAAALRFGREHDLPITVRGGGHGVAGTAVCDDGMVIDLSMMKGIAVDPMRRTAEVQAGALWGELDAATQAFGLATTGGIVSHTGVSGLTLGGGIGWLMRRHGLAVDNLAAAEVVTADGRYLHAGERENPDLFWGLRGGGGGLGVVTSFTYRLHPVGPEVLAGPVFWALEDAVEVLLAYRDQVASAPPELATTVVLRRAPAAPFLPVELHRRPVCMVNMMALGEPDQAERLLAPLRGIGRPLFDLVKRRPYTGLQSMFDTVVPHGWHYYWKSAGLRELDETVINTMVEHAHRARSPWSYAIMFHLGGAVAERDPDATSYSRRDVAHELNVNAVWLPGQPVGPTEARWTRDFIAELEPWHAGAYLNFLDHDDQGRVASAFSTTAYQRLTELRRRFDPDGVFRSALAGHPPAPPHDRSA
jgi:FAD/FMN-containing dehydrogenase/DNA-binding HxlR family transcriptional regulator